MKKGKQFLEFTWRRFLNEPESVREEDYLEEDEFRWPFVAVFAVIIAVGLLMFFGIIPTPWF